MKKIEMIKAAGGIIVSIGVSAIVGNVIKSTNSESTGAIKKLCVAAGAIVLSSMISDKAVEYVGEKFDRAVEAAKKIMEEAEEAQEV